MTEQVERALRKLRSLREDLSVMGEDADARVVANIRMVDARLAQIALLLEQEKR